jgi:hypothetical protein
MRRHVWIALAAYALFRGEAGAQQRNRFQRRRLCLVAIRVDDVGDAASFKAGFIVDAIDAALRWLGSAGAQTDASVFYDAALDVHSFVFRDPFGNRLQVFRRRPDRCWKPRAIGLLPAAAPR